MAFQDIPQHAVQAKKHIVSIMGSHVAYWVYNPQASKTIVMIHGFRGTHEGLEDVAKLLPDYRLLIPDLPGFGASEPFDEKYVHDIEHYTIFVRHFFTKLLLHEPVLLGHSFGSIVAAHFAAAHPLLIEKLILVNPINAPALKGPKAVMTQLAVLYYWMSTKLPEKQARKLLSNRQIVFIMSTFMVKTKDKDLRKVIHNNHYTHFSRFANMQTLEQTFKASISHTVREVAPKLSMPTLLIIGEKDDLTTAKVQKQAAKEFPSAELFEIKNVGHLTHYETPDRVATAVRSFIEQDND